MQHFSITENAHENVAHLIECISWIPLCLPTRQKKRTEVEALSLHALAIFLHYHETVPSRLAYQQISIVSVCALCVRVFLVVLSNSPNVC